MKQPRHNLFGLNFLNKRSPNATVTVESYCNTYIFSPPPLFTQPPSSAMRPPSLYYTSMLSSFKTSTYSIFWRMGTQKDR